MNYIVFDLEWNQCPVGKENRVEEFPFEIIEIGAVKLNGKREIIDIYQEYIRPQVYHWMHAKTMELVKMRPEVLQRIGRPFIEAVREFLDWCGQEYVFCTWGNQDLMELQRNMQYYQVLSWITGPVFYYNVQKIFSICREDGRSRRSLEYAVEALGIEKDMEFHQALTDASYTALIFQQMEERSICRSFSVDTFQHPQGKKDEVRITGLDLEKYVTREFWEKAKLLKDWEISGILCPVCHRPAVKKIRWFPGNSKNYYCIGTCLEHGWIHGRIQIKRAANRKYFGIKTLRLTMEEEAKEVLRQSRLWEKSQP